MTPRCTAAQGELKVVNVSPKCALTDEMESPVQKNLVSILMATLQSDCVFILNIVLSLICPVGQRNKRARTLAMQIWLISMWKVIGAFVKTCGTKET